MRRAVQSPPLTDCARPAIGLILRRKVIVSPEKVVACTRDVRIVLLVSEKVNAKDDDALSSPEARGRMPNSESIPKLVYQFLTHRDIFKGVTYQKQTRRRYPLGGGWCL